MCSAPDDRTTAAVIRDCAMALFADRGTAAVTVREIAAAAGVSPGLVMHHYGSKEGLRDAVDRHAARFVEDLLAQMAHLGEPGAAASLAELFADRLDEQPAFAGYVRRLLCDGGTAADALFERLFTVTRDGVRALTAAGVVRPAPDEELRAAFLLVNDLAALVLRPQIRAATGVDPLARNGIHRWTDEVMDVYTEGIFAVPVVRAETPAVAARPST